MSTSLEGCPRRPCRRQRVAVVVRVPATSQSRNNLVSGWRAEVTEDREVGLGRERHHRDGEVGADQGGVGAFEVGGFRGLGERGTVVAAAVDRSSRRDALAQRRDGVDVGGQVGTPTATRRPRSRASASARPGASSPGRGRPTGLAVHVVRVLVARVDEGAVAPGSECLRSRWERSRCAALDADAAAR